MSKNDLVVRGSSGLAPVDGVITVKANKRKRHEISDVVISRVKRKFVMGDAESAIVTFNQQSYTEHKNGKVTEGRLRHRSQHVSVAKGTDVRSIDFLRYATDQIEDRVQREISRNNAAKRTAQATAASAAAIGLVATGMANQGRITAIVNAPEGERWALTQDLLADNAVVAGKAIEGAAIATYDAAVYAGTGIFNSAWHGIPDAFPNRDGFITAENVSPGLNNANSFIEAYVSDDDKNDPLDENVLSPSLEPTNTAESFNALIVRGRVTVGERDYILRTFVPGTPQAAIATQQDGPTIVTLPQAVVDAMTTYYQRMSRDAESGDLRVHSDIDRVEALRHRAEALNIDPALLIGMSAYLADSHGTQPEVRNVASELVAAYTTLAAPANMAGPQTMSRQEMAPFILAAAISDADYFFASDTDGANGSNLNPLDQFGLFLDGITRSDDDAADHLNPRTLALAENLLGRIPGTRNPFSDRNSVASSSWKDLVETFSRSPGAAALVLQGDGLQVTSETLLSVAAENASNPVDAIVWGRFVHYYTEARTNYETQMQGIAALREAIANSSGAERARHEAALARATAAIANLDTPAARLTNTLNALYGETGEGATNVAIQLTAAFSATAQQRALEQGLTDNTTPDRLMRSGFAANMELGRAYAAASVAASTFATWQGQPLPDLQLTNAAYLIAVPSAQLEVGDVMERANGFVQNLEGDLLESIIARTVRGHASANPLLLQADAELAIPALSELVTQRITTANSAIDRVVSPENASNAGMMAALGSYGITREYAADYVRWLFSYESQYDPNNPPMNGTVRLTPVGGYTHHMPSTLASDAPVAFADVSYINRRGANARADINELLDRDTRAGLNELFLRTAFGNQTLRVENGNVVVQQGNRSRTLTPLQFQQQIASSLRSEVSKLNRDQQMAMYTYIEGLSRPTLDADGQLQTRSMGELARMAEAQYGVIGQLAVRTLWDPEQAATLVLGGCLRTLNETDNNLLPDTRPLNATAASNVLGRCYLLGHQYPDALEMAAGRTVPGYVARWNEAWRLPDPAHRSRTLTPDGTLRTQRSISAAITYVASNQIMPALMARDAFASPTLQSVVAGEVGQIVLRQDHNNTPFDYTLGQNGSVRIQPRDTVARSSARDFDLTFNPTTNRFVVSLHTPERDEVAGPQAGPPAARLQR